MLEVPFVLLSENFDARLPIYEQIVDRFCRALVCGRLTPGQRIYSIRELALELGVNTNTAARAYQEMERAGLIYSKRGTGYFIVEDNTVVNTVRDDMVKQAVQGFVREMRALGFGDAAILDELQRQLEGGNGDEPARS